MVQLVNSEFFLTKELKEVRQAVFLPAPSDVSSNAGVVVLDTLTGNIAVQNITSENDLRSRQGGNIVNWKKLKVLTVDLIFFLSCLTSLKQLFKNIQLK